HPVEVAYNLTRLKLDEKTVAAGLLHDTIEDTLTTFEEIREIFGDEISQLVEGVTKISKMTFASKEETQAENYRKMILAMVKDIRVVLIKLADRAHNMQTLDHLPEDKQKRIARETLDIFAPIANRLGLNNIRLELEDLGFAALYPKRHKVLMTEVKRARGHRKQVVRKIERAIKTRLKQEELSGKVLGREKHLYSLYQKMQKKGLSFSEVLDVYAFRILLDSVDACYRVLGAVHNLYKPVPGKFKDYIAIPKGNGYQSLHTVLFGPYGVPLEVQIRTQEMHEVAESGIAAHWVYKSDDTDGNVAAKRVREWLRELLEMQKKAGDSIEFIENVKVDLFPDQVYVFTPAGEIMDIPRGATAVDFAYAVHTDVGNTCVAVKIDRRYAPLRTPLVTGQSVEVVTAPWGHPNPNWLNFVVTGKARANIRAYLKNLHQGEAVDLGRRLLNQSLAAEGLTLDQIPDQTMDSLLETFGLENQEALLEEVGLGKRIAPLVVRGLLPVRDGETGTSSDERKKQTGPLFIRGTEGMVVNLAKCCRPIPGDPILGQVSAGRGIVIHTRTCKNMTESNGRRENWIEVAWEADLETEFPVEIRVDVADQRGVLATVAAAIADAGANVENVSINDRDGLHSSLLFTLDVTDRIHLAHVMRQLRGIDLVSRILRTRG
ncbi:MAG: guanosine-3',5'-bis(diphosphate) 3'-diphosphatase, partial [Gammaproteobacteria bacterium]